MSVVTVFSGSFCHGEEIARKAAGDLGYTLLDDKALIAGACKQFGTEESKLLRVLTGKTSIFDRFTREKERSLSCLRAMLAETMKGDDLLLFGFAGLMVPREISHVLKVCIIADVKYRALVASDREGISEKDAMKKILRDDESRVLWVDQLFQQHDPWAPGLYDIVIPMDKHTVHSASELICENVRKDILRVTDTSRMAVQDFELAAQVGIKLAGEGHSLPVNVENGKVTIEINKHVMRLSALEEELKRIVGGIRGVREVETKVGAGYYQSDVYRKFDFEVPLPRKVLLVDDEREFVQTLSERLHMRDLGSAVVYDGEMALSVLEEEEPEVMVLDLKMPGIDGLEVLRRVRTEHPDVEVIVLTGHGSPEIEKQCLDMGAHAYLEKPVNVDVLTRKMKEAYEKLRRKRTVAEAAK